MRETDLLKVNHEYFVLYFQIAVCTDVMFYLLFIKFNSSIKFCNEHNTCMSGGFLKV